MTERTKSGIPEVFRDAVLVYKRKDEGPESLRDRLRPDLGIALCGYAVLGASIETLREVQRSGAGMRLPDWLPERMRKLQGEAAGQTKDAEAVIRQAAEALPEEGLLFAARLGERSLKRAFWDLSAAGGCGLQIDLRRIPLRQESVEIFEAAGEDLYEAPGGEAILLVCGGAERICEALSGGGIPAAVIGYTLSGSEKRLLSGGHVSYLNRPEANRG